MIVRTVWILVLFSITYCSAVDEYVCPDPIGRIIRDDCEVYRTKYESLKVELSAQLGLLEAKTTLGQERLRDPSELLQVLAHRTYALCKDFNACRVPPLEYRQRREATDQVFTAITGIQTQLKETTDAESKKRLVQELIQLLEPRPIILNEAYSRRSSNPTVSSPTVSSTSQRMLYHAWLPWYGTRFLPPQPVGQSGFPQLVEFDIHLKHVFRQHSPYGIIGYQPDTSLWFHGKTALDDMVILEWAGTRVECPISTRTSNGLTMARCKAPSALTATSPHLLGTVRYRRGIDGKIVTLDQLSVPILIKDEEDSKNGSKRYGLNRDKLATQGTLIFRPYDDRLPSDFEQPSLVVVLKLRKHQRPTARCWVNDQLATPGLKASNHTGQVEMFQDRPRYEKVDQHSSRAVAEPFIYWRRYDFPLPYVAPNIAAARVSELPSGMKHWPLPGKWRCVVSLEGAPVRELKFTVNNDGRLQPLPQQLTKPSAAWLLETRLISHPLEVPVNP